MQVPLVAVRPASGPTGPDGVASGKPTGVPVMAHATLMRSQNRGSAQDERGARRRFNVPGLYR